MTLEPPLSAEIVDFWRQAGPKRWFAGKPEFDAEIRNRYEAAHMAAAAGTYADWTASPESALALVLLLDQFPRNLYRGTAHAFATDPLARRAAAAAVEAGWDAVVEPELRPFVYMPFTHAEDADAQARSVALFEAMEAQGLALDSARFARIHRDVIARFGRFPHRNAALGLETTAEERAFLEGGGFAG